MTWHDKISDESSDLKETLHKLLQLKLGQIYEFECHNLLEALTHVYCMDEFESICFQQLQIIRTKTNKLKQEALEKIKNF